MKGGGEQTQVPGWISLRWEVEEEGHGRWECTLSLWVRCEKDANLGWRCVGGNWAELKELCVTSKPNGGEGFLRAEGAR